MSLSRVSTDIITYTLTEGTSTIQMNAAQALDALKAFESLANQITSDNQPTPPIPPASNWLGIFNFSGPASLQIEQNPSVAGSYVGFPWALIEPQENQFNWAAIDNAMDNWVKLNKKVILRISASGWKKWWTPPLSSWTPKWVYDKGVQHIQDDDGSIKPCYWDTKFLLALQNFITAFGQKYDNHPNIACIEMGIGDGGETKVDTEHNSDVLKLWQKIGYTDDLWFAAIKEIIQYYKAAFPNTPRVVMPDASFIGGSNSLNMASVVNYAASQGCWLQDNGVVKGENFDPRKYNMPLVSEQRNPTHTSGDTLDWDLNQMVNIDKCRIALIFTDDLVATRNADTLKKYAAMVGK